MKYEVVIKRTELYVVPTVAGSLKEAEDNAWKFLTDSDVEEKKSRFHSGTENVTMTAFGAGND